MANCECHNQMVSIPKMMIEGDDIHQMLNHIHHIHHLVSIHVTCFFLDSIWWFHQAEPKSAHCSLNLEINGFGATHGAPILETPYLELCKLQQEVNHEIWCSQVPAQNKLPLWNSFWVHRRQRKRTMRSWTDCLWAFLHVRVVSTTLDVLPWLQCTWWLHLKLLTQCVWVCLGPSKLQMQLLYSSRVIR